MSEEAIEKQDQNVIDGYIKIDKSTMPNEGKLYPESWEFAYRCPTSKEVANFSTLRDNDTPAIISAVEDLIKKCVVIYDTEKNKNISAGEVLDAHKIYFILLLREYYIPGANISYQAVCESCHELYDTNLTAKKLVYDELSEKLLSDYDGRTFKLNVFDQIIEFRAPTLSTSARLFKYIVSAYREQNNDSEKKIDKTLYDKKFLLIAPYLFKTGEETIKQIMERYKDVIANENIHKAYLYIVNNIKIDNIEEFYEDCPHCGSTEVTPIKFPGGWRKMFVSSKDNTGYFGK